MTLGEVLPRTLKNHGVREVFGVPGDSALPFFGIMEDSRILPFYTLRPRAPSLRSISRRDTVSRRRPASAR